MMTKKKRANATQATPADTFPRSFDFFGAPSWYEMRQYASHSEPSCFNGFVRVERYRVTFERVDEPVEVIHARLLALWRASDNHHHIGPLRAKAAEYGLVLDMSEWRKDRKHGDKP